MPLHHFSQSHAPSGTSVKPDRTIRQNERHPPQTPFAAFSKFLENLKKGTMTRHPKNSLFAVFFQLRNLIRLLRIHSFWRLKVMIPSIRVRSVKGKCISVPQEML